ncbi:MAG: hypothetical protein AAGF12_21825 [Myxococcota bacterium]
MNRSISSTALTGCSFLALASLVGVGGCGGDSAAFGEGLTSTAERPLPVGEPVVPPSSVRLETVAEFPPGTFLENLEPLDDGTVQITSYFDKRTLRFADGSVSTFAELPEHPVAVLSTTEGFIVTAHAIPFTEFPAFTESNRILLLDANGAVVRETPAPEAKFLNGLHRLPSGEILAADSIEGTIWAVDPETGTLREWLRDELLLPDANVEAFRPGANGIKTHQGSLYISNSSRGVILRRQPIATGTLEVYSETGPVDDFVFDDAGTIYATTHGAALLSVDGAGQVVPILQEGCDACTSVTRLGEALIVITTGGLAEGRNDPARVLRITGF